MIHRITSQSLMQLQEPIPVADVRTPAEFIRGHVTGAINIPLFSNEERASVGTTYKQSGREAAILLGFDLAGPKWSGFIREALQISPQKKIALHCWRGGMRSSAMAWALDLYGFTVYLVEGGYKSYRNWVLEQFDKPNRLTVVGGMTGSGKTRTLHQLRLLGEQVIDLEDLARHQGSTYGTLNKLVQPTQEQFENDFAGQLHRMDRNRRIWVEDESSSIGKCLIPRPFWKQLQSALLLELRVPEEKRVPKLLEEYGSLDKEFLVECTGRIRKRLGGERTNLAIAAILGDRMEEFIRLMAAYYDKTYLTGLSCRSPGQIIPVPVRDTDPVMNARQLLQAAPDPSALHPTATIISRAH
jgi:tRNA 2-selenouridine synthase